MTLTDNVTKTGFNFGIVFCLPTQTKMKGLSISIFGMLHHSSELISIDHRFTFCIGHEGEVGGTHASGSLWGHLYELKFLWCQKIATGMLSLCVRIQMDA